MQQATHDYWTMWNQFVLQGVLREDALPVSLIQSWRRCEALGLDPYGTPAAPYRQPSAKSSDSLEMPSPATPPATRDVQNAALLPLLRPAMEDLHQFAEGSECVVVFADADVRIVDMVGDAAMQRDLEHLGLTVGSIWSEDCWGTNALALALQESFPMQIDGAMHFCAALHPLYTSAAPVHDLLGQAVGVLGVIGRHEQCHPHTLGMINAAAQAISNQLQMQVWLSNANDLLAELKTILQTLSEGILLLRRDGVVSQMNVPAGTMLGLSPAKVTGRRLRDVLPLPAVLAQALANRESLSYEELVFDTVHGRVTCLCTLTPIAGYRLETGLEDIVGSSGLMIAEQTVADGFVLILRSIERVQKLVHRMTGARARLTFANAVGESSALKEALRLARLASTSNSTVLLHGETGTGKEIFAQSIHNSSSRVNGPFIAINCAAIPRELITTELFGYEAGSFTGADRQGRQGKFEQAHGGTLFLDEIGDMPQDLQTSLLRAIETRTIVRIGGQRVISADVRIIAATHKDLREEVRRGNFRSDLFYRLNVLTIEIPSLRKRSEDIPLLVQHFLQRQSRILGRVLTITPEAMQVLMQYSWPGNVRELEHTLERATYLMSTSTINVNDLPLDVLQQSDTARLSGLEPENSHVLPVQGQELLPTRLVEQSQLLKTHSMNAEIQAIVQAWQAANGNLSRTATLLHISRTTLWRKMVKYQLTEEVLAAGDPLLS